MYTFEPKKRSVKSISTRLLGDLCRVLGQKETAHMLWAQATMDILSKGALDAHAFAMNKDYRNKMIVVSPVMIKGVIFRYPMATTPAAEQFVTKKFEEIGKELIAKGASNISADIHPHDERLHTNHNAFSASVPNATLSFITPKYSNNCG